MCTRYVRRERQAVTILDLLSNKIGCVWDKQTHEKLLCSNLAYSTWLDLVLPNLDDKSQNMLDRL